MKKLFIGIDFSKEKVDVAIIFADGLSEMGNRVFNQFNTTTAGYGKLVKWVKQNSNGTDPSDPCVRRSYGRGPGDRMACTADHQPAVSGKGKKRCGVRYLFPGGGYRPDAGACICGLYAGKP